MAVGFLDSAASEVESGKLLKGMVYLTIYYLPAQYLYNVSEVYRSKQ